MNALGMHETFVEFVGDGLLHVLIFLKIWWILLRRLGLLPIGWALDRLQAFLLLLWVGSDLLILMRAVVYLKTKTWEEASIVRMSIVFLSRCYWWYTMLGADACNASGFWNSDNVATSGSYSGHIVVCVGGAIWVQHVVEILGCLHGKTYGQR